MNKAILYIHGKGGSFKEARQYEKNCEGYEVIGIDYDIDFPWVVDDRIKKEYDKINKNYRETYIVANSIGAYFAMNSLKNYKIKKALFISPIVNMEKFILDMMNWANVSEQELSIQKEIETEFGEKLSWEYLKYVRKNPIVWNVPTEILYAGKDNLTSFETIKKFALEHNANLTIMENGEHWFHTEEQLEFLNDWMKNALM